MIILDKQAYAADAGAFLNKSHPARILNAFSLWSSFYYSRISGKYHHHGTPLALAVESYAGCTLRCPECPAGDNSLGRKPGPVDEALFKRAIEEAGSALFYLSLHFLGEPMLNRRLPELLGFAAEKSLYTEVHSNGQNVGPDMAEALVNSGLNRLRFSVDGSRQESYERYRRGGLLEKVVQATRELRELKRNQGTHKPLIIWQFIVFRHNEHERKDFLRLARDAGTDAVDFKTAWVADAEDGEGMLPENRKMNRYARKKRLRHCWRPWHAAVITNEGELVPCCFDKHLSYPGGNLKEQHLLELWGSPAYEEIRKKAFRRELGICGECGL